MASTDDAGTAQSQPPMRFCQPMNINGEIIVNTHLTPVAPCWYCLGYERTDELFKPCNCHAFIHRDCFRKWRTGWINPRNYFQCPNCCFSYNIERVRKSTGETRDRIERRYMLQLVCWMLLIFLAVLIPMVVISLIAYFADRSEKNVPVGMKYVLTGVVSGFPDSNSTAQWREEFRQPDVWVWPYYSIIGIFITCCFVIIIFFSFGCTYDQKEHDNRCCGLCKPDPISDEETDTVASGGDAGNEPQEVEEEEAEKQRNQQNKPQVVDAGNGGTGRSSNGDQRLPRARTQRSTYHIRMYHYHHRSTRIYCCAPRTIACHGCIAPSGDCVPDQCCSHCDCDLPEVKCNGPKQMQAMLILIIAVVIIVIVSGVALVVLFAVYKSAELTQKMRGMLEAQAEELEGETMVLGINEAFYPRYEV